MSKFSLALLLIICQNINSQPIIKFTDMKKNFGFVKQGKLVTLHFNFKNTGNQPLLLNEAKVACSCTTVEFPKNPILPQQEGKVVVLFDTKSVYDRQDRIIELFTNAPNSPSKIRFKGVVLKK